MGLCSSFVVGLMLTARVLAILLNCDFVRTLGFLVAIALLSWKPKHTWETRSATARFTAALWNGLAGDGFRETAAPVNKNG